MSATAALTTAPNLYSRILSKFPSDNLMFCFAYGSGVFKQVSNYGKKNMIDFIFAVEDAEKWHQSNMQMNPSHYSALSYFGTHVISKVQTNISSRVYFNSMIPIKSENVVVKYGVITHDDLVADLLDWNNLYIAGRLHKPVQIVKPASSSELLAALQLNLQSAVHAALLLLPEHFTEAQFYKTVTSLSYTGDFRMTFGEDKNKVHNIVYGQLDKFRKLYEPIIKPMVDYLDIPVTTSEKLYDDGEKNCSQDPRFTHFFIDFLCSLCIALIFFYFIFYIFFYLFLFFGMF